MKNMHIPNWESYLSITGVELDEALANEMANLKALTDAVTQYNDMIADAKRRRDIFGQKTSGCEHKKALKKYKCGDIMMSEADYDKYFQQYNKAVLDYDRAVTEYGKIANVMIPDVQTKINRLRQQIASSQTGTSPESILPKKQADAYLEGLKQDVAATKKAPAQAATTVQTTENKLTTDDTMSVITKSITTPLKIGMGLGLALVIIGASVLGYRQYKKNKS